MPTDRSSVAGRVAVEGRTVHIGDIAADAEYSYLSGLVGAEIRSILGVPLIQNGQVIGVIALLRKAIYPFTDRQIELVQTFADQAVIAIENARLFKEVKAADRGAIAFTRGAANSAGPACPDRKACLARPAHRRHRA